MGFVSKLGQDFTQQFSTLDCLSRSTIGASMCALASRFIEPLATKSGAASGAILGASTSIGLSLAGKDASNNRKVVCVVMSLALTTFLLLKVALPLTKRYTIPIHTDQQILVGLNLCNLFG